jgi:hypothetical protein
MDSDSRLTSTQTGKTMGDLLDGILIDPKRWLAVIALLVFLSLLVLLVMGVFTWLFGVETKEVQFGGADSHVIFHRVDKQSGNQESVVVVNPEGWQKTGVQVRAGDRISFYANGKICIDLNEIVKKSQLLETYENKWTIKEGIKRDDPSEKRVPEDYFTAEERKSLILNRPWVDPDGFDLSRFQPSFRSRRSRYLLPDDHAGGLVAAIKGDAGGTPVKSDAFFVGRFKENYSVSEAGWLWFTVNDVQYNDLDNPYLFYNDNIGSFWVRVVLKHG